MVTKTQEFAIEVSNLSKCYQIFQYPQDRLKQFLWAGLRKFFTFLPEKSFYREFWAVRDVSFKVKRGEMFGIIGQNGSGKSTLLQLICGTLGCSSGSVLINGRIAALLELGAGFNPEFTGRENIFLNCTVLGLKPKEIEAKFNEIVQFADIGDFIDQPVKTYSSGMYVRLAFAAAINVDPDILVVDEALAVGDARFILKCFKKIEELKRKGVTILFVTHDTDTIKRLCSHAVLLEKGIPIFQGEPKETVAKYYDLLFPKIHSVQAIIEETTVSTDLSKEEVLNSELPKENLPDQGEANKSNKLSFQVVRSGNSSFLEYKPEEDRQVNKFGNGGAWINSVKIYGLQHPNVFEGGEEIEVCINYSWKKDLVLEEIQRNSVQSDIGISIALADKKGIYIFGCNTFDAQLPISPLEAENCEIRFKLRLPYLLSGEYFITSAIALGTQEYHVQLRWYDYYGQLVCRSCKKYVYGVCHLDYQTALVTLN